MKRLRSDQRGVAMVTVMGVLLVTSILAFAVAATAQRTSEGTVRDSNSKRALAAAETGLNVGRFKVGQAYGTQTSTVNDSKCYPDVTPSTACAWSSYESAGNGARFRYWVSPVLATAPGITCVAAPTPSNPAGARERCVTAVGEVEGVQRQVQMRVVENRGAAIFPFPGLLGLNGIELNMSHAVGTVGTNGELEVGPNSEIRDPGIIRLGGSAWSVTPPGYGAANRQTSPTPFTLDFYTKWYSDSVKAPSGSGDTTPPTYGTNQIGTLTGAPGFSVTGTRQASLAPNSTVTLAGGRDYNFCSLKLNSGARLVVPAGTTDPVRIFVDSSTRPGSPDYVPSGCPSLNGNIVDVASGGGFVNETGKASMLQLFVYGPQDVEFNASANFTGTLWAPQSEVEFNQGATLTGALAAREIEFNQNGGNVGFTGDPEASNVAGRWSGSYKRSGWRECSARSGC